MKSSVVIRSALVVLLAASGQACTRGDQSPQATQSPATTQSPLPEESEAQALESSVLAALRADDPNAQTQEHTFNDAFVEATIEGQKVTVHVAAPDFPTPGPTTGTDEFDGVAAKRVSTDSFGIVWRFSCGLDRFGTRLVDVAFASKPETVVPTVYRLLACKA